ncbi:ROK family protein [Fulvivirgaceae bacterium BMA10]|uniref:ROK family protein n=1 Tax=Splendidivirga corallicola TaxID=3051826 RepID=A0ABT8KIM2_9BACT|nr:ROK family protein [Fulvivirgaceae bacterium BMA10]
MHILGIDIGGTGIKGAPVDIESGKLLDERLRIPTPQPATPENVIETVAEIARSFNWKEPIGCGFPAAIKNETVMTASNIDRSWIGLNAGEKIGNQVNCPVHLVNDVDAAGLAEATFGAGRDKQGVVIVAAVGTGIGTALFTDGKLVPNTELGHILLNGMVAEKYVSNAVRKNEELTWEEFGKRLNEYLNRLDFLFWPDAIILGGGASKKFELFKDYLDLADKIEPAMLLNNAGIVGAALSAKEIGIALNYK